MGFPLWKTTHNAMLYSNVGGLSVRILKGLVKILSVLQIPWKRYFFDFILDTCKEGLMRSQF